MVKVRVVLDGITPLLLNPMTEEILQGLYNPKGSSGTKPLVPLTPQEVAEKKVPRNTAGQAGIPSLYLFSCLIEGGRLIKVDTRRAMSTKDSSLVPSFLSIEEEFLPFAHKADYVVDMRRGVLDNAGKKVSVAIVRPRFDKWSFEATLLIDENEIAVERVRQLVEKSGNAVGLGDFRPAKRGPFGRFRIANWEVDSHLK
jgi:hypothetical protein